MSIVDAVVHALSLTGSMAWAIRNHTSWLTMMGGAAQ